MKKREKLIAARMKRGLSQDAVAGLIGVSRNSYNQWELGNAQPHPYNIGRLCEFFYVKDPAELDLIPPHQEVDLAQDKEHNAHNAIQQRGKAMEKAGNPDLTPQLSREKTMDEGRRHLMQDVLNVTGTAMVAPALILGRLVRVLAQPSTTDGATLRYLETKTADYWLRFDRSRLEGYRGTCYRRFYSPEDPITLAFLTQAQNTLKDALAHLSPSTMQRRPALLIDLASTYTQQREIREACELVIQAIIILAQLQSRTGMQRLSALRQELAAWNNTSYVKNVEEHIQALLLPE